MKLSSKIVSTCAAIIAVFLAFPISSTMAQGGEKDTGQSNPGYSGAPGTSNPETIDDATLKQTARAYTKVQQITQREQRVLNDTRDDATKQKVTRQAESEKLAAVKAEGLQPQRYNLVIQLVQADNDLQQRFLSYVNNPKN